MIHCNVSRHRTPRCKRKYQGMITVGRFPAQRRPRIQIPLLTSNVAISCGFFYMQIIIVTQNTTRKIHNVINDNDDNADIRNIAYNFMYCGKSNVSTDMKRKVMQ